jgi:drug/metabolite transporter superfamily protein YnfA
MKVFQKTINKLGIFGELLSFLWKRKLWWLIPMMIVLVLFGLLLVFTQSSAVAPFIYTLF